MTKRFIYWLVVLFPYSLILLLFVSQNPVKITGKITISKEGVISYMLTNYDGILEFPSILNFFAGNNNPAGGTDVHYYFANLVVANEQNYIWYPP